MQTTNGNSLKLDEIDEMKSKKSSLSNDNQYIEKTNWRLIIIAGVICALNAVENSVIGIGEWPYMKTIDKEATAQYFGYATSASKFFHAIFALVFSVWSFKSKSIKIPLAAGRFVGLFACIIYLGIEYVPFEKRYVMATVYILLGIANSASTILRAYIATYSTSADRPRAFAVIGLSVIVSIVVGPLLQLIFSTISYPGFEMLPGMRFHIYSAPIWFSFVLTILTIFIILFYVEDSKRIESEEGDDETDSTPLSIEKLKAMFEKLRNSKLDWGLIAVCLVVKIAGTFSHATMQSIISIFFMVQYGWTGEETVRAAATIMIGFGVLCSLVLLMYIFCKLGEKLPQHKVFLVATIASGMVFVITYPYEFTSNPVVPYNETTGSGCSLKEYSWCDTALAVNPILFLVVTVAVSAPSIPLMHTALDTVYSRILGSIDQSIAQGAMTVVDDIIFMVTPIFTTTFFTYLGVAPLWIAKASVFFFIAVVWGSNLKKIGRNM